MGCETKGGVKNDSQGFDLSHWKDGIAFKQAGFEKKQEIIHLGICCV